MKHRVRFISAIICTFLLASQGAGQKSKNNFLSARQISSVAVFPTMGETVPQAVRDSASKLFLDAFRSKSPDITIIPSADIAAKLEQQQLLEAYAHFAGVFAKTGIAAKGELASLSESAQADALLFINIQDYREQGGSWMRSRGGYNKLVIQYTLFSKVGEQLWQNTEIHEHESFWVTRTARHEELVKKLSQRAVKALLEGKQKTGVKS